MAKFSMIIPLPMEAKMGPENEVPLMGHPMVFHTSFFHICWMALPKKLF